VYVPTHFEMGDEEVRAVLGSRLAGDLVTWSPDLGLDATTVPFVHAPAADGWGSLHGHLARANSHWRRSPAGEAMVILRGPDGYVSPSWYASKREHGRVVPTWDYVAVHVHGELAVHDDADWVRSVVERLTELHETPRADPWSVDDAPADFVAKQLRAVVGIELRITRIEAKAKLSQNRSADDVRGVVDGLRRDGHEALSAAVARAAERA
jgi:transcriptional regulator